MIVLLHGFREFRPLDPLIAIYSKPCEDSLGHQRPREDMTPYHALKSSIYFLTIVVSIFTYHIAFHYTPHTLFYQL